MPVRLSKDARREQLLDTAATLLLERSGANFTMEGLAAAAGVSKAVPYLHFENADDVLSTLHARELAQMADRIGSALERESGEAQVAAVIGAFLDVVAERGAILAVLPPAKDADPGLATTFVADLLRRMFDLPAREADVAAHALFGALMGLISAWATGAVSRRDVERVSVDLAVHLGRSKARSSARATSSR